MTTARGRVLEFATRVGRVDEAGAKSEKVCVTDILRSLGEEEWAEAGVPL